MDSGTKATVVVLVVIGAIVGGALGLAAAPAGGGDAFQLIYALVFALFCVVSILVIAATMRLFSIDSTLKAILSQMQKEYDQKLFGEKLGQNWKNS